MAMSRKHYTKVAAIIAGERAGEHAIFNSPDVDLSRRFQAEAILKTTRNIALSVADMFAEDSSAFQRDKFYEAAGVTDPYSPTGVAA